MTAARATLAILAGGEGSRMGKPKGLLEIGGRPILLALLERIAWQGPTLLVTAPGREHPPGWQAFDREVSDPVVGEGPLRGVLTALENAGGRPVVVAVVDMPRMMRDPLEWLVNQLAIDPTAQVVMTRRGTAVEPFPSAWRAEAAELVRRQLATGRRAVHSVANLPEVRVLPAPDWPEAVWTNLNTPEDLEAFGGR